MQPRNEHKQVIEVYLQKLNQNFGLNKKPVAQRAFLDGQLMPQIERQQNKLNGLILILTAQQNKLSEIKKFFDELNDNIIQHNAKTQMECAYNEFLKLLISFLSDEFLFEDIKPEYYQKSIHFDLLKNCYLRVNSNLETLSSTLQAFNEFAKNPDKIDNLNNLSTAITKMLDAQSSLARTQALKFKSDVNHAIIFSIIGIACAALIIASIFAPFPACIFFGPALFIGVASAIRCLVAASDISDYKKSIYQTVPTTLSPLFGNLVNFFRNISPQEKPETNYSIAIKVSA